MLTLYVRLGGKFIYYCNTFSCNREIGNSWALDEAKRNLQRHYFLIGVTEELNDFVEVLENVLPRFFKGAYNFFLHSKCVCESVY